MKAWRMAFKAILISIGCLIWTGAAGISAEMLQIYEIQSDSHPNFDDDAEGFKAALAEEGFIAGSNVVFACFNAEGDPSEIDAIVTGLEDDSLNLIHAIGTPSAQASVMASKTIPVVFSSVADPVAAGVMSRLGSTGTNVTGVSDRWPVELQCSMYQDLVPYAKRWGTIYNLDDAEALSYVKEMSASIETMGGRLLEAHISDRSEVPYAALSLVGRVDAIHITADDTTLSAFASVVKVCNENNLPLFSGDRTRVMEGAIAAYGPDHFLIGYAAGKKAAKILLGEKPNQIPVELSPACSLWVNLKHAKEQGLKLPRVLIEKATDKLWDEQGKIVK